MFNLGAGKESKQQGMLFAALNKAALLDTARQIAMHLGLASINRRCTIDDVYMEMVNRGYDPTGLGNAAGSVFKTGYWRFTGLYTKSTRVSNHARDVKIWELKS